MHLEVTALTGSENSLLLAVPRGLLRYLLLSRDFFGHRVRYFGCRWGDVGRG